MATPTTDEAAASKNAHETAERGFADDEPPAAATRALTAKKQPPPETPESIRTRNFVILSFWAFVLLLGLPIWWRTTAVYRANLPLDEMMDWAEGRVRALPRSLSPQILTA